MSGRPVTKRTLMMVEAYRAGGSLRLVAWIFGCSKNRVNLEALFVPETEVETEFIEGETLKEASEKLALRLREAKLI
ncbi:hypothetical protein LCGC14_2892550 [marine sediment metagenome]|uniref:Uncharacterized protein n=1 Tax=marine sediment metagenome TaxID=412755 RepID=A0A0F9AMX8_9ZZZZ